MGLLNPHAPSNRQQSFASTYKTHHERLKNRAYEQRVREVEHGSFTTPVMFATNANVRMRCKLSYALLRSAVQCIRGAPSAGGLTFKQVALPADLAITETNTSYILDNVLFCVHQFSHFVSIYL